MRKQSAQQKDIRFVSIYVPNIGPPKYIKQIFPDLHRESNIVIVGNFKVWLHPRIDHQDGKLVRNHSPYMTRYNRLT